MRRGFHTVSRELAERRAARIAAGLPAVPHVTSSAAPSYSRRNSMGRRISPALRIDDVQPLLQSLLTRSEMIDANVSAWIERRAASRNVPRCAYSRCVRLSRPA
jgi:hypothetical protein